MEKRIFKTLVKAKHKNGRNKYVRGRISGIQRIMCVGDYKKEFANTHIIGTGIMMETECTSEQYDAFAKVIEELYPGLCIFDYEE